MKAIKIVSMYFAFALIFFQCQENELIAPQQDVTPGDIVDTQATVSPEYQTGSIYYVNTNGNDGSGNGSSSQPWKTLKFAVTKVSANQGHTIKLGAGTFIENGLIEVPPGVNIEGSGKEQTIIKAASSFYYNPSNPGYATEKFLISLNSGSMTAGNQILKNFGINGDSKKLHGGVYVHNRSNTMIDQVKIQSTNFTGIWLWDVKNSKVTNTDLINCSWGSTGYCVGALNLGNLEDVEIAHLNVDESTGYGIKAIGPGGYNNLKKLIIRDSRVSVHPYGLWNGGSAPNIAIELWSVTLTNCEIYNTYVDNTISLVNSNMPASTGVQTIRVHHNVLDMGARAQGAGYGVELTLHDAEIDHNYFIKGSYGIANWDNAAKNWKIHHNTFYNLQGTYPGEIVRSQWSGLHNVKLYNNTIEFSGNKTMNVVGVYGGTSDNVEIKNNLVINSNTGYSYYQNQLIHRENGAVINNLQVRNNLMNNLDLNVSGLLGGTLGLLDPLLKNLTSDPKIKKTGSRPEPYYVPDSGSPLINGGTDVGLDFNGPAPDIGAYESGSSTSTNAAPQVSITSPANNSTPAAGSSVTISANASDSDGAVSKVEFFNGSTKLGEDATSPYSISMTNVVAGSYSLTARATDNSNAVSTSGSVNITVGNLTNSPPVVSITSPSNNATFTAGSSVIITANASDSDGSITKVEFIRSGTRIGTDTSSPYSFTWGNAAAGTYKLTVRATDNKGAVKTSSAVDVTVAASSTTNTPPVVSLISPANNSSFAPGASITITANAIDQGGSISKVEFYRNGTKLGQDASAPFSFTTSAPSSGNHTLTAKAFDNNGVSSTCSPVTITISSQQSPFVELSLDASQATLSGNMKLGNDSQAGSYFSMPAGSGKNYYIPPSSAASYNVQLPKTDTYTMWVRVKSPSTNNQTYYIYDGRGRWTTWQAGVKTQWTWVKVTDAYTGAVVNFSLVQGNNNIQFGWMDDNVQVDKFIITNNPAFAPN